MPVRLFVVQLVAAAAACSTPGPSTSTDPRPLVSGIDLAAVDAAVRVQDDLFQHVNGGWLTRTDIPADRSSWGTFDRLVDKSQNDLRVLAEEAAKAPNKAPGSDVQKIGDFYESFMNEARIDELGIGPIKAELAAIDAIRTREDLARHFARFFRMNLVNPIIGYVDGDAGQPDRAILYLYQGGLGMPDRDYYLRDEAKFKEYREKYVSFVQSMLTLGAQPSPGAAAREIFTLETRLARAHWTNVESRDAVKTYNKIAVADLPKQFPGFDWNAWATELGVGQATAFVVNQPSYLKAFAAAVQELPVERWKPYLKASLINGFAPFLSQPFVDAEFDFYRRTLRGVKEIQPRWKRAVNALNANVGDLLGRLYVERHFTPAAKARMEQLVENLREAYRTGIDGLDWMSADTKKQAQEKLAKFTPKIGYPNKWRDYSALEIARDDLVGNLMRAYAVESAYQLGKVGKPVDPDDWGMTPQTVNAYYNPVRNEIVFPAAILQPPFFNMEADDAANYGAIGAVIGHEMGHGFDDQGRNYDASGALRDWWTRADADEYQKRAKVIVEQYNQLEPLPGLKVNGELTLGENIADLTGLVIAHRAYKLSLRGQPAPVVDGMSGDQRYFMGWAQAWAGKMRDDARRQQVVVDPHSPEMFRANAPARNVPEFYETFGVKEGDKMYLAPERRAKIW